MRTIHKGTEPPEFTAWKALANEDWKPHFDELRSTEKEAVVTALVREQHGICCYCEQPIDENSSHIEHQVPQSAPEGTARTLDYSNFLASCIRVRTRRMPLHCGALRDDWYTPEYVSPLEPDCASHFRFREDGAILPMVAADERATETIKYLGLDLAILREKRRGVLEDLFGDGVLTPQELRSLVDAAITPDSSGRYDPGFPSFFESLYPR